MEFKHIKNTANITKNSLVNDTLKGTYFTRDNGGKPYKVVFDNYIINVYDNYNNEEFIVNYTNYEKIWIGESPKNKMTEFSGGYGINFLGNSFLIKLENNNYIHIGREIFSFKSRYNIIHYISPVGNNDVPYPYCIDEKNNYYLLLEYVICKFDKKNLDDPYEFYYNRNLNINILQDLLGILGYMCYENNEPLIDISVNQAIKNKINWNDLGDIKIKVLNIGYDEYDWNNILKYVNGDKNKKDIDNFLYELYYKKNKEYFYINYQRNAEEHYDYPWMKNLHIIDKQFGIEIPISKDEYKEINNKISKFYNIEELNYKLIKKRI